jgi:hypothetical protein
MTREEYQFVLDLFKQADFPPLDAQAQELIRLGMPGIGYLLLSPELHADGGFNGRKRVAYDQTSAASVDQWVLDLHREGYTPVFRYYFLSAAATMDSLGIKNLVVHRARYGDLVAVVESVPDFSQLDVRGAKKIPKLLSKGDGCAVCRGRVLDDGHDGPHGREDPTKLSWPGSVLKG